MLLHDGSKSEDAIHGFFKEAYELYVKVRSGAGSVDHPLYWSSLRTKDACCYAHSCPHPPQPPPTKRQLIMNPFFEFDKPVVSPAFDARIRALEKRYLR